MWATGEFATVKKILWHSALSNVLHALGAWYLFAKWFKKMRIFFLLPPCPSFSALLEIYPLTGVTRARGKWASACWFVQGWKLLLCSDPVHTGLLAHPS